MEHLASLAALAGVWLVAVVTPGPDFAATVHASLSGSRTEGIWVALGVTCGMACWSLATLLGLNLVFSYWPWLFAVVKVAGATYLLIIGVQMIMSAHQANGRPSDGHPCKPDRRRAWRRGILTNLSNPKAMLLFGSLIALMLPANPPPWLFAGTLLVLVGIPLLWYVLVALLFSMPAVSRRYGVLKRGIDRLTGGVFLFVGARFAASD